MPPEAITGMELAWAMRRRKGRFGPARVPSVAMSVVIRAATPLPSKLAARASASTSLTSSQPRVATRPLRASMPTTMRPWCRAAKSRTKAGCSIATVPKITRSRPIASRASARSRLRTPPPSCTGMARAATIARTTASFTGSPLRAPSKSTRWSRSAPCRCQARAWATGSPEKRVTWS